MSDIQVTISDIAPITIIADSTPVVVATPVNGVSALDQLNDVDIPSPTTGQALLYNGSAWTAQSFSATDASFVHNESPASDMWTITHNLGKYPSVTIVDSANDEVEGNVNHISINQLTITFSAAFSGKAFLN